MRKTDLAYAAGIMDGEGSIGIYANTSKKGNPVYRMRVRVNNTDEWLIHWLHQNFGGCIGVTDRGARFGRNWKPAWYWTVSCRPALLFLNMVSPYLRLKKPQAEIAIRFQETRKHSKGKKATEEELAISEIERTLIKNLNKRGL